MSEFLVVVVTAMVAQAIVLPGEKVQFIVAGLSTRYRPAVVVGAAGLAFAGWTAVEIWLGEALQGALPAVYLDAVTAGLFLLFGVLLLRSMPDPGGDVPDPGADVPGPRTDGEPHETDGEPHETDGGRPETGDLDLSIGRWSIPEGDRSFLPIFLLMAAGEFGDKTQLVTISLAVQYGAHPGIWVGEMLVILPVTLANAYFFHRFSGRFDPRKAHRFGAAVFFFFGLDTVLAILTGFSVWETVISLLADGFQAAAGGLPELVLATGALG